MVFLGLYLKNINYHQLEHLDINWWYIAAGSALALAYRYSAVYIWRVILRSLGIKKLPPFGVMVDVFAKAWMARYIPGTVTWVAGRIYLASAYGLSKSRLTVSSLLEGGMQIVSGVVIALPLIGLGSHAADISMRIKVLSLFVSVISLIALLPPVFNKMLYYAFKITKRREPGEELKVNSEAVIRSFLLFALANIVTGFANFLIARAINVHLSFDLVFYLIGTFSLAGALGIATPFLPSGIGVRDGVQLVLLSLVMPKELALAITVFTRLWGVGIDIAFFGIANGLHRLRHTPTLDV